MQIIVEQSEFYDLINIWTNPFDELIRHFGVNRSSAVYSDFAREFIVKVGRVWNSLQIIDNFSITINLVFQFFNYEILPRKVCVCVCDANECKLIIQTEFKCYFIWVSVSLFGAWFDFVILIFVLRTIWNVWISVGQSSFDGLSMMIAFDFKFVWIFPFMFSKMHKNHRIFPN